MSREEQRANIYDSSHSSFSLTSSLPSSIEATDVSTGTTTKAIDESWHIYPTYEVQEDDGDPAWVDHLAPLAPEEAVLAKEELDRERKRIWITSLMNNSDLSGLPEQERYISRYQCTLAGRFWTRGSLFRHYEAYLRIRKYVCINLKTIEEFGYEALSRPDPCLAVAYPICTSENFETSTWGMQSSVDCARDSFVANHIAIVENLKLVFGVGSLEPRFLGLRDVRNRFAHDWKTPGNGTSTLRCERIDSTYKALLPDVIDRARTYAAALHDPSRWREPEMPLDTEDGTEEVYRDDEGKITTNEPHESKDGMQMSGDNPHELEAKSWTDHGHEDSSDHGYEDSSDYGYEDSSDHGDQDSYPEPPEPFQLSRRIKRKVQLRSGTVTTTRTSLHRLLLRATPRRISPSRTKCLRRNGLNYMTSHRASFKTLKALMGSHESVADFDDPDMESDRDYLSTILALNSLRTTLTTKTGQITIRRGQACISTGEWDYTRVGGKGNFGRIWGWMDTGPWTRDACTAQRRCDLEMEIDSSEWNDLVSVWV
ncbi:hypothetical protein K491DRAFT_681411 [Lophiostoma macrostomum CBS 122681]|uniref:Uncharacterized protein n=1 Tax=Lophiostoma macrostomum CBS 122681 TaxID=1314788 RepID=A0A6A6SXS6_9PLEO|nr:hypothetical protein K491DRAFT_681411 [Lophiostoma macrostomum CBS 122681]